MLVRAAGLLDLPKVVALAKAASEETGGWFGWTSDEAAAQRFARLILGLVAGWVLVACADDVPRGVLVVSVQNGAALGEYLYVEPGARSTWNGALAALVRAHRKLARACGLTRETILAAPSRTEFWCRHGYTLQASVLSRTIQKRGA